VALGPGPPDGMVRNGRPVVVIKMSRLGSEGWPVRRLRSTMERTGEFPWSYARKKRNRSSARQLIIRSGNFAPSLRDSGGFGWYTPRAALRLPWANILRSLRESRWVAGQFHRPWIGEAVGGL
jgi:hypothetical protein